MRHVRPAHHLEKLRGEVDRGAGAGSRVENLAGILLEIRDELRHRLHRQVAIDHEDARHEAQLRDRREVLPVVVRHVLVERRIDAVRGNRSEEQGIAVGRRRRHARAAEVAAGAGLVHDDEGLAEALGQLLRDQAGDHVGRPARGERHDQRHRLVGIVGRALRVGSGGGEARRENQERRKRCPQCNLRKFFYAATSVRIADSGVPSFHGSSTS